MSETPLIEVCNLAKTFWPGLEHNRLLRPLARLLPGGASLDEERGSGPVHAVRDVSFVLQPGQVLGYLGPNGSGKTTSIKCLLGLIQPTGGTVRLLGQPVSSPAARARIGYLPEHPYFYDYLKPTEVLDYVGRLYGIDTAVRRKRIPELLERLGLGHAMNRTLRSFSKGMLQRCGIAQSLISDPDLLIYDEPLSGLDPIGRKELRDLLGELRAEGKSLFITTHVLSDIETLCDSVVILDRGRTVAQGRLDDLLHRDRMETAALIAVPDEATVAALTAIDGARKLRQEGARLHLTVPTSAVPTLVARVAELQAQLVELHPRRDTLEELFMRKAVQRQDGTDGGVEQGGAA